MKWKRILLFIIYHQIVYHWYSKTKRYENLPIWNKLKNFFKKNFICINEVLFLVTEVLQFWFWSHNFYTLEFSDQ